MGHIKVCYDGKHYSIDENETVSTLKTKVLNLPPEMILVDEGCKILKNDRKIRETGLRDGEVVMPLVNPGYGS
jgi:hypothetical protein